MFKFPLTDALVAATLDVRGIFNFQDVDKLFHEFCKRYIFVVRLQIYHSVVLGELGSFQLFFLFIKNGH